MSEFPPDNVTRLVSEHCTRQHNSSHVVLHLYVARTIFCLFLVIQQQNPVNIAASTFDNVEVNVKFMVMTGKP